MVTRIFYLGISIGKKILPGTFLTVVMYNEYIPTHQSFEFSVCTTEITQH